MILLASGGEHPSNFINMGMTECEACKERQRARSRTRERRDKCPLSPTSNILPQWLGTRNVHNLHLKTQTSAYTRKYQPAHLHKFYGNPPHFHPPHDPTPTFVYLRIAQHCRKFGGGVLEQV